VTHLFAALFYVTVLMLSLAMLWSMWEEHRAEIVANLPWRSRRSLPPVAPLVRRRGERRGSYWATPSISSDAPIRAMTVSPATVR
jgi:hypothetical protein